MVPVNMPVVGQDIPTGIIKEWLKQEGDKVEKEEIIASVESEKATFDVEAPADGILLKILKQEDEEVEVLTPIAYIGLEGESVENDQNESSKTTEKATPSKFEVSNRPKFHEGSVRKKIFVSPLAKKIAYQEGLDLAQVKGTGPGGRITKKNVLEVLKNNGKEKSETIAGTIKTTPQPALLSDGESEVAFTRMRQIIADKLTLSKQTIPHFYLFLNVEMDKALVFKKQLNVEKNISITVTDLVVYAVAKAMIEFPRMNAHVYSNKYILFKNVNIGLAVSSEDGLRVPVIPNADKSGLKKLSEQTKKLALDAREGKIDLNIKAGLTISTLGMFGIDSFIPIINPPESAILALGKSSPKVVTDGTNISIKNIMPVTLACDHRLIDGTYGADFLGRVKELLETSDFRDINW